MKTSSLSSTDYHELNTLQNKKSQQCHIAEIICISILCLTTVVCLIQIIFIRQEIHNLKLVASHLHVSTVKQLNNGFNKEQEEINNKNKRDIELYSTRTIRDHIIVFDQSKIPEDSQAAQEKINENPTHVISSLAEDERESNSVSTTKFMQTIKSQKNNQHHVIQSLTTETNSHSMTTEKNNQGHVISSLTTEMNSPNHFEPSSTTGMNDHIFTSHSCTCPAGR
jgi:hypothetical protein